MNTAYIVTNNLILYSDRGILGFFPTLLKSRDISAEELIASIPDSDTLTVYFNAQAAEHAVRGQRTMALVEDLDTIKGANYRSITTPVVLEVQLKTALLPAEGETSRIIDKELFDLPQKANVISYEQGYNGSMPASINIPSTNQSQHCSIM